MNSRITWILLTAVAVLFGYIYWVELPSRDKLHVNRKVLPDFDPATVTRVVIGPNGKDDIQVERGKDGWRMIQPLPYPAESSQIEALLTNLTQLQWDVLISDADLKAHPHAQEEFGFLPAQAKVLVEGSAGTRRLLIGTNSAWRDQVYVQVEGNGSIYLVNSGFLKFVPVHRDFWRESNLVNLAGLPFDTLKVSSGGKTFQLEREPGQRLWRMKSPQARADTPKIDALLNRLQDLAVERFVTDDPQADLEKFGWQGSPPVPALELSFQQRDTNVLFSLQFGGSPATDPSAIFARRLGPSNIVQTAREPLRGWQLAYTNFLDRHFLSVPSTLIDAIEIKGEDDFTLQEQTNGTWLVVAGETFPADVDEMNSFMAGFTNLQVEFENFAVADLAAYGLTTPRLQYTLKSSFAPQNSSNNVLAQIQFGTNLAGRVYERRTNELSVNSIALEEFDRLPRASWQMRDRRIWNFDSSNVVSITIHHLGGVRKLIRDPLHQWTFAPGSQGLINDFSLEETLHRLGEFKAVFWTAVGDEHLEPYGFAETAHEISLEVKKGDQTEIDTIEFGKTSPYSHPYASVVRNGRRLVFEFPASLYELVHKDLGIPAGFRRK